MTKNEETITSVMDGFDVIMESEENVFLADTDFATGIAKFNSTIHVSGSAFFDRYVAFAIRKSFPYKEEFNRIIQQLLQSGLVAQWKREFKNIYYKQFEKSPWVNEEDDQIMISDVFQIFKWLYIGIFCAIMCLFMEKIHLYYSNLNLFKHG